MCLQVRQARGVAAGEQSRARRDDGGRAAAGQHGSFASAAVLLKDIVLPCGPAAVQGQDGSAPGAALRPPPQPALRWFWFPFAKHSNTSRILSQVGHFFPTKSPFFPTKSGREPIRSIDLVQDTACALCFHCVTKPVPLQKFVLAVLQQKSARDLIGSSDDCRHYHSSRSQGRCLYSRFSSGRSM